MGFSGKPSKACEVCRCRRTRRPQCGQCSRKNITCSYRDLVNLAFRSENDVIVRRVRQAQLSSSTSSTALTPLHSQDDFSDILLSPIGNVSPGDAATAFFMSKFAYGIYHDYVPALYKRRDCSAALKSSVEAVGLATLSLARSESSLLQHARRYHLAAVKEIQVSLNSANTVNRADTLAAIMLLALFAGITCEPTAARIHWTEHIKGALAVLNSRSDSPSDDPVVNVLSSHVTSCVLVDCLQSVVGPPKQFTEIKFEPRIPVNFQQKSEYVLNLLAELKHRKVSKDNVLEVIEKLDIIDSQLDDLLVVLPKKHPRTIVSNSLTLDEPVYHIYPRLESARVWNIIRLTRLSSFELRYDKMQDMRKLGTKSFQSLNINIDAQEEYASTSAQLMVHDICACIPKSLRSPDSRTDMTLINWAHSLLWPLSAARASPHAPEHLRPYMDRVLQNMWDITNFPIVDYHKKRLEDEEPPQIWTHVLFWY